MGMPKNTVRRRTIAKLRGDYFKQWRREWPFYDAYLAQLWREVQDLNERGNSRTFLPRRYEKCLMLMRECHCFEPDP